MEPAQHRHEERPNRIPRTASDRESREALDVETIADLSDSVLCELTGEELIRVILAGHVPLAADYSPERLRYQDRGTLLRLAHIARRTCRNLERDKR